METEIKYESLDNLCLDPLNPRLGRENSGPRVTQEKVLQLMEDWSLEEIATSFLENGFWPLEPLIVVREELYGKKQNVVVEGNRRLAALSFLQKAFSRQTVNRKWSDLVSGKSKPSTLFSKIPYLIADSREEVDAFLGFRHVTGIKEWRPAEKAEFIAKLIEKRKLSYDEVRRKIGSRAPTVRQHYISYRLLLQMEDKEEISLEKVESKFSVLYLSLRTEGVQKYLHIDIKADPAKAKRPVPPGRMKALAHFAQWLFGDDKKPPLFTDSRNVDIFGKILESEKAVEYLERTTAPSFDFATRVAGADAPEILELLESAADQVESALSRLHLHKGSAKMREAAERLFAAAQQAKQNFPEAPSKA